MSTCKPDGSWTSPIHFPRGQLLRPHVLETPDKGDMPCIPAPIPTAACKPLNLTYNPNEEDGAGFYCTPPIDWSNLPVRMSKPTVCYLVCNMMLVATVQCKEGVWTGHPEIGFWCNQNNAPVDFWKEPMTTISWNHVITNYCICNLCNKYTCHFKHIKFHITSLNLNFSVDQGNNVTISGQTWRIPQMPKKLRMRNPDKKQQLS